YPRYPDTFWSFKYALKFISKKASFPPLGLVTVAALLPQTWKRRLVDLNVDVLKDEDIRWADYIFISAMAVQEASVREIVKKVKVLGKKVVAGGPLFTISPDRFPDIDHLVLNEAEATLSSFIEDVNRGEAKPMYTSAEWPDITSSPTPEWDLLDMRKYAAMCVQYCRGCPFDCEFCDIGLLNGKRPRTKTKAQVLAEIEGLYQRGWKGTVFFVDDNFIGKPRKLKEELLPALIRWVEEKRYPFSFLTEASVNLADDEELMELMVRAGFDAVFVGIESPEEESLTECHKVQNKDRDLTAAIKKMQRFGLQVLGGFIVGFDSDHPITFQKQVDFIQQSGIVTAMVGLLNAPKGTKLYERLQQEGRILGEITGDNTDFSINFIPKMGYQRLVEGYRYIVTNIYSPRYFYKRLITFLRNYRPSKQSGYPLRFSYIKALFHSFWALGIRGKERLYYWKTFFWTVFRRPQLLSLCVGLAIYGYHFRKVFEGYLPRPAREPNPGPS
ncbi:MAG: DUF4070 domain-containing protein, partial [Deltaproteobacteria bacterium]|nr:DUF4070 domain-containing protein [Deltaproteobacteria bacterium]